LRGFVGGQRVGNRTVGKIVGDLVVSETAMQAPRTPALHKPRSFWPTPAGTAVSKDVWVLGTGLTLLADAAATRGAA